MICRIYEICFVYIRLIIAGHTKIMYYFISEFCIISVLIFCILMTKIHGMWTQLIILMSRILYFSLQDNLSFECFLKIAPRNRSFLILLRCLTLRETAFPKKFTRIFIQLKRELHNVFAGVFVSIKFSSLRTIHFLGKIDRTREKIVKAFEFSKLSETLRVFTHSMGIFILFNQSTFKSLWWKFSQILFPLKTDWKRKILGRTFHFSFSPVSVLYFPLSFTRIAVECHRRGKCDINARKLKIFKVRKMKIFREKLSQCVLEDLRFP